MYVCMYVLNYVHRPTHTPKFRNSYMYVYVWVYSALGVRKKQMIQLRLLFLSLFVLHTTTRERHISRLHTSTDHPLQPSPQSRSALSGIE